jgi:hypothetical protein
MPSLLSSKFRHACLRAALILYVPFYHAQAAPARYICPQELPSTMLTVQSPQPGWKPFVGSPLYLSDAAPADGPPERLGILRGEEEKRSDGKWRRKYSLSGRYPEGKWLRCDYGALGEVSLALRLPDALKECTVIRSEGQHAGEHNLEILCE